MHIYHYASYEVTAIKRLMGQFATRDLAVDQLLKNEVFVDLYSILRQALAVGTRSYSLKDIESLYMGKRETNVATAAGSIVAYHGWIEKGESQSWKKSPALKEIRDYNEDDCKSTLNLAEWLWSVRQHPPAKSETSILDLAQANDDGETDFDGLANDDVDEQPSSEPNEHPNARASLLAKQILADVEDWDEDEKALHQLHAWLLEFHWREARPVFWRMYERHKFSDLELQDDIDCLGGMTRTKTQKVPIKKSFLYEYQFDPSQDTKLGEGHHCFFAHDLKRTTTIESIDEVKGLIRIKVSANVSDIPKSLGLIPNEYVRADAISNAVYRYVESWRDNKIISRAVADLLQRKPQKSQGTDGEQSFP
ncbi:MAG: ribonuclease H-like domain-containing protein [Pirellulaceae bacterium]